MGRKRFTGGADHMVSSGERLYVIKVSRTLELNVLLTRQQGVPSAKTSSASLQAGVYPFPLFRNYESG